ncbi:hypothetical protein DVH24_027696 [Malus domestica]|uniref:Uncharacterized protein n=1 Tax=Malus domestica TaxID=3750 RepID=A0A498H982_MALDO|nr:hypothetical protein DVH24_027696 [Malus domestica]
MRNSEMLSALGVRDEDFIMIVSNAIIYGCNAFDTCSKEEATTLMELLWHGKLKLHVIFFSFMEFIILLSWQLAMSNDW